MLRCTAVIQRGEYSETRRLNVPVLPRIGDVVTYGTIPTESFVVKSFEYEMNPDTGDCTAIKVHLEVGYA